MVPTLKVARLESEQALRLLPLTLGNIHNTLALRGLLSPKLSLRVLLSTNSLIVFFMVYYSNLKVYYRCNSNDVIKEFTHKSTEYLHLCGLSHCVT